MARRRGLRQQFTVEQVRTLVTRVMEDSGNYAGFAPLLGALMAANNDLGDLSLARLYGARTGRALSRDAIRRFRTGEENPGYGFIADLLDHNLLNFDPSRICRARDCQDARPDREALFTAAGLTEVTPESIQSWNRAVFEQLRQVETNAHTPRPRWIEFLRRLIVFHTQGGRMTLREVADNAGTHCRQPSSGQTERLLHVLYGNIAFPTLDERQALYHFAELNEGQIWQFEEGIRDGRLSLAQAGQRSPFADRLNAVLNKLRDAGVRGAQFLGHSRATKSDAGFLSPAQLSAWRHGKGGRPTIESLRVLAALLRPHCGPDGTLDVGEINHLVEAAGFSAADLAATSHDVIVRIDDTTGIKPLLIALRTATDISSPAGAAVGDEPGPRGGMFYPRENTIREWERPGGRFPNADQVLKLLARYNRVLESKGLSPLTNDEVRMVAEVAERDYSRWLRKPHAEKASGVDPPLSRRPL
jgi:hypothetical protein